MEGCAIEGKRRSSGRLRSIEEICLNVLLRNRTGVAEGCAVVERSVVEGKRCSSGRLCSIEEGCFKHPLEE